MRMIQNMRRGAKIEFARDERGAIAIITAAALTSIMCAAAIAIDVGMLYLERRQSQGAVDLAAMAAAGDLKNAEAAAKAVLAANGITTYSKLEVITGNYDANPAVPANSRFVANTGPFNAARVHLEKQGQSYFARVFSNADLTIGVTGTAANADLAAFSAGSRLLAVRDGVANAVLGSLLGANISLSLADYEALVRANITMTDFLNELNAAADLDAATYNDVIASTVTIDQIATAAAGVADKNGDTEAAAVLKIIRSEIGTSRLTVPLDKFVDLGPLGDATVGTPAPGLDTAASALDIVSAAAVIANGKNQVSVNLGATIPGLTSVELDIAIGEPPVRTPWLKVGQPGATVYTAQIRIRLIAKIAGSGLLSGISVRIPLYIEAAHATARLADVRCMPPQSVKVAATPGVVAVHLGDVVSFGATAAKPHVGKAQLVKVTLAEVYGYGKVAIENISPTEVTFAADDIAEQNVKRVSTTDYAQSLITSVIEDATLEVNALVLSLAVPRGLAGAVADVLQTAAAPLDALMSNILTSLGIHLGEVDVRVHGIQCGSGGYLAG